MDKTNNKDLLRELINWWYSGSLAAKVSFICSNNPPLNQGLSVSHVEWPRLMLCLCGRRSYLLQDESKRTIHMRAGQAIYFAPGTWIAPLAGKSFRSLGIHWENERVRLVLREDDPLRPPKAVFSFAVSSQQALDWHRQAQRAAENTSTRYLAEALILKSLARVMEQLANGINPVPGRRRGLYMRIIAYLEENFASHHSRNSVAERFRISPGHLTRLFRTEGARGFNAHIQALRLREAKQLLDTSRLNVQEVALRCGFTDPAYFSRVYRRHFGHPPSLNP